MDLCPLVNCFLKCGIPQGTILGPLFFLLFINDLPNCLSYSIPRTFADDTNLTFANNDMIEMNKELNIDLVCVNEWLVSNKLSPNISKTEFMLIGSRQKLSNISHYPKPLLDNTPIKQVKVTKSLGVYIDESLLWDSQIDHICKKIASGIGALKRIKYCVPFSTILTLFKSLIEPHFDYCCIVWGNCNKGLSDKLQKLQTRAARVLLNATYDSNADQLFEVLGWQNLTKQRLSHLAIMVFKSLKHL